MTHCPTTNSQRAQRAVHLLPPQLCRQGLILELGLQNSCVLGDQTDHCTIYHNNILWEPLDFGLRELLHGVYLRVVIGEPVRQICKKAVSQSTTTECQTEERPTKYSRSRTSAASSMSSTQGLQMYQSSTRLHRQKTFPLLQHSASYPSLGYAHPGVVAQHSTGRRGRSSSRAEWTVQVRRQYIESSICEDPEEGPVVYWTTWYLHHQRYLRNMESRTLRLDRFASHWHRDLQDLWAGVIDPLDDFQVFVVNPEPPADDEHQAQGHLLIVQGQSDQVPVLLSTVFDHPVHRRLWRLAVLMPAFVQTLDVNEILSLQRWCTRRRCEYHSSSGPWHEGEVIPLQPGEGLQITITQQPIQEDHDGLGFMQTSCSHVRDDIRGTQSLHRDRWLVDVAAIFHDHQMTESVEEGPIIYIWTWFINHQTSSRCRVPRALRLPQDPSHWLREVMALWQDVFQPGDDTLIQIIHPQPVQAGLRIDTPHLMIEQKPSEGQAAVVLSTFFHETSPIQLMQEAFSVSRWLSTSDLIDILEINPLCDIQRCTARLGGAPFDKYIRHDIPSAASIEMHVQPARCLGDPAAGSAGDLYVNRQTALVTSHSLVQTGRWLRRSQAQIPQSSSSQPPQDRVCDEYLQIPQRVAAHAGFWANGGPMPTPNWPLHWATLQEVWHYFFEVQDLPADAFIRAEVWFSDHCRRPWSDAGRIAQLGADLGQLDPEPSTSMVRLVSR